MNEWNDLERRVQDAVAKIDHRNKTAVVFDQRFKAVGFARRLAQQYVHDGWKAAYVTRFSTYSGAWASTGWDEREDSARYSSDFEDYGLALARNESDFAQLYAMRGQSDVMAMPSVRMGETTSRVRYDVLT
jgi:hypothetical protein